MTIRDEAPDIFRKLEELATICRENINAASDMNGADFNEVLDEDIEFWRQMKLSGEMFREIHGDICAHSISDRSRQRFIAAVSSYLNGPSPVRVHFTGLRGFFFDAPDDWFSVGEFHPDSVLDRSVYFTIIHPDLLTEAKARWGDNVRVCFDAPPPSGSYEDERHAVLRKYGVPEDTLTWMWAYEALSIAELAGQKMNLKFRLSDFVTWTCTDDPGYLRVGAQFGEPELFAEATFGQRIELSEYERIQRIPIWKGPDGAYVSPLWEYLGCRAENYVGLGEYARNLADIGEALDVAVLSFNPEAEPEDVYRVGLTMTRVFRAGEAVTKLRVKFEIENIALKGMRAEYVEKARAEKGGRASASARAARRTALLGALEDIVRENPILAKMGPKVAAPEALSKSMESQPTLWSQGQGQIDEYLGEIRRGEAGRDLQARFLALFPTGTA